MLEFDRSFASVDLASEKAIVLGLTKGNAGGLVGEHQKIVSDNEVKFLTSPIPPLAQVF